MYRNDTWVVKPDDERPARPDGTCFYCGEPIGARHKEGCVIPQKSVVVNFSIQLPILVPQHWDKEQIEYHYNLGTWCWDNLIGLLDDYTERSGLCLCSLPHDAEYLGDADEEQDEVAV